MEELVGVLQGLVKAKPTHLVVLVVTAIAEELTSDHGATILDELQNYTSKLATQTKQLRVLRINLQLYNCQPDQAALECVLWNSKIMHKPSPWPNGTTISLQCFPAAREKEFAGACKLSLYADSSRLIRSVCRESGEGVKGIVKAYKMYRWVKEPWCASILRKVTGWLR